MQLEQAHVGGCVRSYVNLSRSRLVAQFKDLAESLVIHAVHRHLQGSFW